MRQAFSVPKEVSRITQTLEKAGFEAYLVGGCVRDLILGRKPKDWDVTTNATPEKIVALFEKTYYENDFGTVGVVNEIVPLTKEGKEDTTVKIIEVTPYRLESAYSDNRRPDAVLFSQNLDDDLKRRDFTINAIAYNPSTGEIVDLYGGREDIEKNLIRAVGNADERFKEDALRTLRAVRIATELGFTIEEHTEKAVAEDSHLLKKISSERIRDEFSRIIMSAKPMNGLKMAQKFDILQYISHELVASIGIEQNKAHSFDVWEHSLRSLQHAADKEWALEIRLAALFHDIGKPATRRFDEKQREWTFYGHEVVGAKMTKHILSHLKFSREIIETVTKLVRWHMFFSDTESITLSAVRRMIANVGKERIWDLMNLRMCDRIGTGRPKEDPYRLRKYRSMIEEAMHDPISVAMLKIDGNILIQKIGITAGPRIGYILHALLEEVLEDPSLNTIEYLENKASQMALLSDQELKKIGESGKEKKDQAENEQVKGIRKRYWVS
jgi:tRNA nucleotidyltransferase (CCA-adding enzyme)